MSNSNLACCPVNLTNIYTVVVTVKTNGVNQSINLVSICINKKTKNAMNVETKSSEIDTSVQYVQALEYKI